MASKEELSYRLDLQLPDKQRVLVVETVYRLPFEVQEFVIKHIQFFSGRSSEFTVDMIEPDKRYVIILCPCKIGMFTVANEIAHSYLGHGENPLAPHYREKEIEQEKEANRQTKEWLDEARKHLGDYKEP